MARSHATVRPVSQDSFATECKRLVAALRQAGLSGAERHRISARLVDANIGTIIRAAKRHSGNGVPFRDLVQEGALALLVAVQGIDLSNDVDFDEYAARCVHQHLAQLVGGSIDVPAAASGLLEDALAPDPQTLLLEDEKVEKAHALLALLGTDEARVVKLRFGIDTSDPQPSTYDATARSLGMKRGRVSALESRALLLLRRAARRLRWTFPR